MYNLTNITDNANNWYEIVYYVNDLSNGLFFAMFVILITFTYYIVFKKQKFKDVFLAGNFFGAIIATILFAMKLVISDFLIIPWLMFFAALLIYIFNND